MFGHKRRAGQETTRGGQNPATEPGHRARPQSSGARPVSVASSFFKDRNPTVNCLGKKTFHRNHSKHVIGKEASQACTIYCRACCFQGETNIAVSDETECKVDGAKLIEHCFNWLLFVMCFAYHGLSHVHLAFGVRKTFLPAELMAQSKNVGHVFCGRNIAR